MRCSARRTRNDPRLVGRVARIVERVRRDGDRAVTDYARQFDQLTGPIEVSRAEMRRGGSRLCRATCDERLPMAAANIRQVATRQLPRPWTLTSCARCADCSARAAARSRRLLRARGAISTALFAADDGHPGDGSRACARSSPCVPGPTPRFSSPPARPASRGSSGWEARTLSRRWRTAPGRFHPSTRSSARATPMSQLRSRSSPPTARSTSMPDRVRSRSCRRRDVRRGSRPISSPRPNTIRMHGPFS